MPLEVEPNGVTRVTGKTGVTDADKDDKQEEQEHEHKHLDRSDWWTSLIQSCLES